MKIKTSELTGPALDWAVAKALGVRTYTARYEHTMTGCCVLDAELVDMSTDGPQELMYSRDWSQGGPIIDREHIDIRFTFTEGGYRTSTSVDAVHATINLPNGATVFDPEKTVWEYGPTSLVAAMRCFVASRLGDEVDIPDELF